MYNPDNLNPNKIKQIFLILIITALAFLIVYHLSMFIPSLLGAITLYVVFRNINNHLIEVKGWKSWISSISIIITSLVVLVLPIYFFIDMIVGKIENVDEYLNQFNIAVDKIHLYIQKEIGIDILDKNNIEELKKQLGNFTSRALSTTFNTFTVLVSMYFILYFMLEKPRAFERIVMSSLPFKKWNSAIIGQRFRKLVLANAVGLPVVSLGQGLVSLIGYLIFGAPNPLILFALTSVTSMIPIVGGSIVYVPICLFMIANGDTTSGVGLLIYCIVAVGLTDNIIRFTLLKKLENIHPLNTVFGIIMGMNLFGFMGLIFGPILVSMTVLLMQVYKDEFNNKISKPPIEISNEEEIQPEIDPQT